MSWVWRSPIAHRGLHDVAAGRAENSLAALDAAARAGYPVEIDVRLTADGQPVVVHDDQLGRLTGAAVRVSDTPAARLRGLRLCGTDARIPTLREAADTLTGRAPVLVDLKTTVLRVGLLERAVRDCLRDARVDWAVASFNPRSVGWFARHAPGVVRGHTLGASAPTGPPWPVRWAVRARIVQPWTRGHFLAHELAGLPNPFVGYWRARGLPVVAWTARTPADLGRARAVADNVIFEDLPSDALAAAGFPPPATP